MHTAFWTDLLVPGIPVIEKIVRPIIIYLFLVAALRLSGKRELAQLNPFDLVVLLTLSNTVQNAIIGNDNSLLGGIIGATTLMGVNYLVIRMLYRHPRLGRLLKGEPTVLIEHGRVLGDRLVREAITIEELTEAARKQGFESLEMIERAELDSAGQLVFTPRRAPADQDRHAELLAGLAALAAEVRRLREQLGLA